MVVYTFNQVAASKDLKILKMLFFVKQKFKLFQAKQKLHYYFTPFYTYLRTTNYLSFDFSFTHISSPPDGPE